ncbi:MULTISPECIES: DUF4397 domain-containing protein [unclassified Modestobacter]|uniref:DUF4397 domain-containing protein n=1 Tax=unclassified Modestobacter TaxID=2643866 RepID=UPI0022AA7F93|nr:MULTISPECIES: DUF4397 domain-containing protein [unclassified Modestobacter]MCZ2825796.1 DUF4397 domain-containing protein [Modestobacter sp. VKM Ac-2981]MCZ2853139.1 DUF4397 domain-containing protein [Modestobacter sp. VKM Ac-2982]
MRRTRTLTLVTGTAGALVVGTGAAPALAAEADPATDVATVTVLHAIPDVPVDVYANGEELIADFEPGTLTDPLLLPAGDYDLEIFPVDADPLEDEPTAELADVALTPGLDATVTAFLAEDGTPTLVPFVNDVSVVPAGQSRLVVRHVAAAPAVDVRADGVPIVTGLENPDEEVLVVDPGVVSADAVLAGTDTVAIDPVDLDLAEGAVTTVYAYGSEDAGYQFASQTSTDTASAPTGVPGGEAGLADDELPLPLTAISLAGLAAAAVAGRRMATSRS